MVHRVVLSSGSGEMGSCNEMLLLTGMEGSWDSLPLNFSKLIFFATYKGGGDKLSLARIL